MPWVLLGSAEQHLSSSLTGMLIAGVPLVGTVFALATGGADRLGRTGLLGLLIGLAGVVAIVWATSGRPMRRPPPGRHRRRRLRRRAGDPGPSARRPAVRRGDGPVARPVRRRLRPDRGRPVAGHAALARTSSPRSSILAVVCTAAAFLVFAALIARSARSGRRVITYINPAVAAVLGVARPARDAHAAMALGFGLVIVGSVLATRRPSGQAATIPQPAPEAA